MAEGVQLFKLIFAFSTILRQFTHDPVALMCTIYGIHIFIVYVSLCVFITESNQHSLVIMTYLSFKITVHLYSFSL